MEGGGLDNPNLGVLVLRGKMAAWYFHDLWRWDGKWQRLDLPAGGRQYAEPVAAESVTFSNEVSLSAYGQRGVARRWRWDGAAWRLEETRQAAPHPTTL